jgi:ABC-type lipoprotein release transport system permease subunit
VSAVWRLARADARGRVGSLVFLAVLAGLAGGIALATVAGARRADTAFERLTVASGIPDIDIEFDEPVDPSVIDEIAGVDGVEGATLGAYVAAAPAEGGLVPFDDVIAFTVVAERGSGAFDRLLTDGRGLSGAADEVLFNKTMAEVAGVRVGDDVTLVSMSRAAGEQFLEDGEVVVDGPERTARVVGILGGAEDIADVPEPYLVVPLAYTEQNDVAAPAMFGAARVGDGRLDETMDRLRRVLPEATVTPSDRFDERIVDGIEVQVVGLLVLAGAVALAGLGVVVQAVGRIASGAASDDEVAGALGMTRGQRRLVAVIRVVPAAVVAAALAVVIGYLAAPTAETGLARQAEPDPGRWFDSAALVIGAVAVIVVIAGAAALGARRRRPTVPVQRVGLVDRALASGFPPLPSIGVRRAFGTVDTRWVARAGVVAVVAAVAAVAAVLSFTRSVDGLLGSPEQWGADFDVVVEAGFDGGDGQAAMAALEQDDEVDGAAVASETNITAVRPGRGPAVFPLLAIDSFKGDIDLPLVDGRSLGSDDEALVGQAVLHDLRLDVGDDLVVQTESGDHPLRIVGEAVTFGTDRIDNGIAMTRRGATSIGALDEVESVVIARFAPGVDHDRKLAELQDQLGAVDAVPRPSSIDNFDELGALPLVLAVVVVLLGAFGSGLTLTMGTHRSRRELATLRALGASRPQLAGTVLFHAETLAVIGVLVGVPIGLALGRAIYRAVIDSLGALGRPVVPLQAVLALAFGTLAVAALLAVVPSRRATDTRRLRAAPVDGF